MNLGKLEKTAISGEQSAEFSGDGRAGVVTTFLAQHGTAYHPKGGSLIVTMPIEGNDGNSFSVAPETKAPKLAEGESAFGNFACGAYMIFRNSGIVEVVGNIQHTGNQTTSGTITAQSVVAQLVNAAVNVIIAGLGMKNHKHDGGTIGSGTTGEPQ